MRWLITGGCGFIGRNLVRDLLQEGGHYLRIVDNLSVGTRGDIAEVCEFTEYQASKIHSLPKTSISSRVDLIVGDIKDEKLALMASSNMDVVIHLAANTGVAPSVDDPRSDCMNNVLGTLTYLEAARHSGANRFIFASSGAPVGGCTPPIHEELAPHPVSPYGASKLSGEGYCSAYHQTFGVETVALRFGNVYGPLSGRKDSVVAKFIKRAIKGEPLIIYGDGCQTRDFIFIGDLIRAIRMSVNAKEVGGEIFQIATNNETTIGELVETLLPILSEAGIEEISTDYDVPRRGDVKRNFSDTSKAKQMLKWKAEVDLKEGLKRTVDWFMLKSS